MTGISNRRLIIRPGFLIAVVFLFGSFAPLPAADYQARQGVQFDKGRAEMRLSDELRLTLGLVGPSGLEVQSLQSPVAGKEWQLTIRSEPSTTALEGHRVGWQQAFRLRPTRPGQLALAVSDLRYRENAEGDWKAVHWSSLPSIQVTTEILNPDPSDLRGITGPEPVPPAVSWWPLAAGIGGSLAGAALLLAGWSVWRRRGNTPIPLAPDQWAAQEIDRIGDWPRGSDIEVERFYTALCDVVRKYLELRFRLPALEQTTTEFFETLRTSPQLSPEYDELLHRFLKRCDLVKFARAASIPEECQEMLSNARSIILAPGPNATART
jgi:Domain of unknown function (DUF4381)